MARISIPDEPYTPYPTAQPSDARTPNIPVQVTPGAFGGQIGEAIRGLGNTMGEVGNKLAENALQLQGIKNDAEEGQAFADLEMKMGKAHADFTSLKGKNATEGFEPYQKQLDDMRTTALQGLSNDAVRRSFNKQALSLQSRTIFNGAGHAGQETKNYLNSSLQAEVDSAKNGLVTSPTPENLKIAQDRITEKAGKQADMQGLDGPARDQYIYRQQSNALYHYAVGLSEQAPFEGKKFIDAQKTAGEDGKSKWWYEDLERAERFNEGKRYTVGARNITDEVIGSAQPGESDTDLLKRAEVKAESLLPGDVRFKDTVVQDVRARRNQIEETTRKDDNANFQRVGDFLGKQLNDGNIPDRTSISADPIAGPAFDKLPEARKYAVLQAVEQKSLAAERRLSAQERLRKQAVSDARVKQYKALSNEDVESLSLEDLIKDPDLNGKGYHEMVEYQNAVRGRPNDPHIPLAMGWIDDMIPPEMKKNPELMQRLKGGMKDFIEPDVIKNNGHMSKYDDVQKWGRALLHEEIKKGWLGEYTETLFNKENTDAEIAKVKADPRFRGQTPTQQEINSYILHERAAEVLNPKPKSVLVKPTPVQPPGPEVPRGP